MRNPAGAGVVFCLASRNSYFKQKWGAGRLPIFSILLCRSRSSARTYSPGYPDPNNSAARLHVRFVNDSHRKSGVFSFRFALSPVESSSLRSSMS